MIPYFFFSSRRRHTRFRNVTGVQTLCSSDLGPVGSCAQPTAHTSLADTASTPSSWLLTPATFWLKACCQLPETGGTTSGQLGKFTNLPPAETLSFFAHLVP